MWIHKDNQDYINLDKVSNFGVTQNSNTTIIFCYNGTSPSFYTFETTQERDEYLLWLKALLGIRIKSKK